MKGCQVRIPALEQTWHTTLSLSLCYMYVSNVTFISCTANLKMQQCSQAHDDD